MSMVKYILAFCVFVWITLLVLMPKEEIYYKLEEMLLTQDIALNEEEIEEGLFGLELKNISVYVKGINVANIKEMTMFTLFFYTSLEVKGLHMDDSLKNMVPQETEEALFVHSLMDPLFVSVKAVGSFGSLHGKININDRKVYVDFNESKGIQMLKPQLKKGEKGWIYETSF